jgi:hypothetical protein
MPSLVRMVEQLSVQQSVQIANMLSGEQAQLWRKITYAARFGKRCNDPAM